VLGVPGSGRIRELAEVFGYPPGNGVDQADAFLKPSDLHSFTPSFTAAETGIRSINIIW
jgi:hypothetical protein